MFGTTGNIDTAKYSVTDTIYHPGGDVEPVTAHYRETMESARRVLSIDARAVRSISDGNGEQVWMDKGPIMVPGWSDILDGTEFLRADGARRRVEIRRLTSPGF